MERKIGEIFNYQDNWYQCIENTGYGCIICHFNTHNNICCNNVLNIIGNCLSPYRKDYKSVVFRKLEKVGNPIMVENKSYQKIKVPDALCNNCAFYDNFSRNCKLSVIIVSAILIKLKWNDKCTIGDLLWGLFLVVLSPASLIVIIIVELVESGFFKKSL